MSGISKVVREYLESSSSYPFATSYSAGAINLASNQCPYPPSPRVRAALRHVLKDLNFYPDPWAEELRKKISAYTGIPVDQIQLGNGSDELLDLVCRLLLNPKDKVLIPVPTFSIYELRSRLVGAKPVFFSLPGFRWSEKILRQTKRVKLVFICRPNNPTGNSLPKDLLTSLLETRKWVVVDEAYVEFSGDSVQDLVRKWENLIVLRTFSKAFGLAGLRIGYALLPKEVSGWLREMRLPFSVNSLALVAASAALEDLPYMRRVVERIRKERERLRARLQEMGLEVLPSEANFLMVRTPVDADRLVSTLERKGILIRSLSRFRGAGKEWVRITVGRREENNKLISALGDVLK